MYICSECKTESLKWTGQCSTCNAWNTLEEKQSITTHTASKKKTTTGKAQEVFSLQDESKTTTRTTFKSDELNTVLGGGLVQGSFTLISGEPGIGKSTLTLQVADWYATKEKKVLYVSGEEDVYQISDRAKRLGIKNKHLQLVHSQCIEDIFTTLAANTADLVIVDSVSVMYSESFGSSAGSIVQIRAIAEMCMHFAKQTKTSVILIGHVNKWGDLAGPKALEHLVDTVLFLEGSTYEDYRILRSLKNRFGPVSEVGMFSMTEKGLMDIKNPSIEFINREDRAVGSALGVTLEGTRPILVEVEALTTYTKFGYPKRSSAGLVSSKLDLLIAIITKFSGLSLESYDVYANIARGLRIAEPGIDLATIAAIASARKGVSLGSTVFLGEVSLTGKIKTVFSVEKRLEELDKLGFEKVYLSTDAKKKLDKKKFKNLEVKYIKTVQEFFQFFEK